MQAIANAAGRFLLAAAAIVAVVHVVAAAVVVIMATAVVFVAVTSAVVLALAAALTAAAVIVVVHSVLLGFSVVDYRRRGRAIFPLLYYHAMSRRRMSSTYGQAMREDTFLRKNT